MVTLSEPILLVVAGGAALFAIAAMRIFTAEGQRRLDLHFVQVEAMKLRNRYAEQVLSLSSQCKPTRGAAPAPIQQAA